MSDWAGLRTAAVIVAWVTVAGGLILGAAWLRLGGGRAFGPDDELMAQARPAPARRGQRFTALTSAQIGLHGFFGIATAVLVAYAVAQPADDRPDGYLTVLAIAALALLTGLLMFRKWSSDRRPAVDGNPAGDHGPKVEDGLPKVVVYLHGLAALTVVGLVVLLFVVD